MKPAIEGAVAPRRRRLFAICVAAVFVLLALAVIVVLTHHSRSQTALQSGAPLRYRIKNEGSFVLYSVGEDGRDDDGDGKPVSSHELGLWGGPDAVWPAPAER